MSHNAVGVRATLSVEAPAMHAIRFKYTHFLASGTELNLLVCQQDLYGVACFICGRLKMQDTLT